MSCSAVVAAVSCLFAAVSCLFAALSALYARGKWYEARRANDLQVHSNRVEIYRGLSNLRNAMQAKGVRITSSDVVPFFRASQDGELYFANTETSKKLKEYFDVCFRLAECTRKLDRPDNSQAQVDEIHKEQDRLSALEQSLFAETERRVVEELRRAVKPGSCVV